MVYVLYIFNLHISEIFRKLKIMILAFHITLKDGSDLSLLNSHTTPLNTILDGE
jgi:hypothetical protein